MNVADAARSSGPERNPSHSASRSDGAPDRVSADVGIVCSHKGEVKSFLKRLDRQRKYTDGKLLIRGGFLGESLRIAIIEAGPAFASHRAATELLVSEHRPSWVINCGFSSALDAAVQAGDLCLANEIADTHGNSLPVKCTISPRNRIHVGRLIVADERPADADAKRALASAHPGLATDTSSLAVAQVCHDRGLRCFVVRAVVDEIGETISPAAASMLFEPGGRAVGSAFGVLARGVRNWSELSEWRTRATRAADHLDRFITGIVEQIAVKLGR